MKHEWTPQRCCALFRNAEQLMLAATSRVDETRPLTELLWTVMQLNWMAHRTLGHPDLWLSLPCRSRCKYSWELQWYRLSVLNLGKYITSRSIQLCELDAGWSEPVILKPAHHRLLSLYFMLCKLTGINSVIIPKPLTSSLAPVYFSAASTTKDSGSTLSESWFHEGLFHKRSRANFTHCIKVCLCINICLIWQCLTLCSRTLKKQPFI